MHISSLISVLVYYFCLQIAAHNNVSKLMFIFSNNSMCIDGSPAAYYLNKGYGSGLMSWFIYFQGGGWCYSFDECLSRANTDFGSSTKYLEYSDFSTEMNYFSRSLNDNVFYNWNTMFLKYCDGGSYTGNTEVIFKGKTLYFKGANILSAFIKELSSIGGNDAAEMVISGGSAGGLSALMHVDKFKNAFPQTMVVGLPDSGFFLPINDKACKHEPYERAMNSVYNMMNSSGGVHPDCLRAGLGSKCMISFSVLPFLKSPIFAIQSKYDTWEIPNILCTSLKDKRKILEFGIQFKTEFVQSFTIAATRQKENGETVVPHGGFLDSCLRHIIGGRYFYIEDFWNTLKASNGLSQHLLFRRWYHNIKELHLSEKDKGNKKYNHHSSSSSSSVAKIYFQNESSLNPYGNC